MFGSTILDVAIGVIFVYLLLSLICTAINEAVSSLVDKRGANLFEGIKNLLNDPQFTGLAQQLYNHGLIDGISQHGSDPGKPTRKPSYIPAAHFGLPRPDILGARGVVTAAHGDLLSTAEQADDASQTASEKAAASPGVEELKTEADQAKAQSDAAAAALAAEQQRRALIRDAAVQAAAADPTSVDLKAAADTATDAADAAVAAVKMLNARRAAVALAANPKDAALVTQSSDTLEQALAAARTLAAKCPDPLGNLQHAVEALPPGHSKESLLVLIDKTRREVADVRSHVIAFQANVETWFNDSMARVSGWYKRWSQQVLYLIAAVVVVLANADTINLVQRLSSDNALRSGLLTAAESAVKNGPAGTTSDAASSAQKVSDLLSQKAAEVSLPLGWKQAPWTVAWQVGLSRKLLTLLLFKLFGLTASTFAVALGAPFWFDTLSRVVNLRGAGTPPGDTKKGATPQIK